jgi:hypothetical protein
MQIFAIVCMIQRAIPSFEFQQRTSWLTPAFLRLYCIDESFAPQPSFPFTPFVGDGCGLAALAKESPALNFLR